jgi:YegS/Rv2252/BmrU family lipid kinase
MRERWGASGISGRIDGGGASDGATVIGGMEHRLRADSTKCIDPIDRVMQDGSRTLVMNPISGSGDHAESVRIRAREMGFDVRETEGEDDAVRLAREAAEEGISELAVCGGDGTINEALRGLEDADYLDEVTLSVIPAGTANLLAGNIGVHDVAHGLELAGSGPVRSVDVGMAEGEPFIVSCIAGLPAEASTAATSDLKERFGTLAFLVTALQEAASFEPLSLEIETRNGSGTEAWAGEAIAVLVGNARKFVEEGGQADMEDGLFDVAVVERMPAGNLVTEAITHRILGEGTEHVQHFPASEVEVACDGPIRFSRDGELFEREEIELYALPRTLDLRVGEDYDPDPNGGREE